MKFCPNCGKEFDDVKGFCGDCGVALKPKAAPAQEEAPQQAVNASPQVATSTTEQERPHKQINIQLDVTKMQGMAAQASAGVLALLKENRIGRGVYSLATVGRLLAETIVGALIIWSWVNKLEDLQNADALLKNGLSMLPSMTPWYILMLASYAFATFLIFKRLKDMGVSEQMVKIGTGVYGALSLFAIYLIHSSLDKLYDLVIAGMTKGMFGGGGANPMVTLMHALDDINLAGDVMMVVNIAALVFAFFKGTDGPNEHGAKPTSL